LKQPFDQRQLQNHRCDNGDSAEEEMTGSQQIIAPMALPALRIKRGESSGDNLARFSEHLAWPLDFSST
jgi:hypothetical protein